MKRHSLAVIFCAALVLSGWLPEHWAGVLEFNREAIGRGELWRLLTGSLMHFGSFHSLMNALGFALVHWHLLAEVRPVRLVLLQGFLMLVVGVALWCWSDDVVIYRGYSGAFIGLLVVGLLYQFRRTPTLAVVILSGLAIKLALEHMPSYDLNYLKPLIGVPVAVDAHLYGAIAGVAAACVAWAAKRLGWMGRETP